MTPTFFHERGRFAVEWPDPTSVELVFEQVRPGRDGDVSAEVSVHSYVETGGLLHQTRVNLISTRSRQEVAKHLMARDPMADRRDWHQLLETACRLVLTSYRKGAPAVYLRDVPEASAENSGFALSPVVLATMPTFLFGDGGSGKSLAALAFANAIHTGLPVAGLTPERPRRVALLDWEMDAAEHRKRLAKLAGPAMPDILYVPCARPLADDLDRIREIVADKSVELVIVDSVALACDGPPEAAEVATRFFAALRQLEVGALCIAHVNRSGDTDRPFGSTFWHNSARLTWYAKREKDPDGDTLAVGLFSKKHNTGAVPAPVGLRFTFEADRIAVARTDVARLSEFAVHVPLRVRLASELATGLRTIAEVADALEEPSDSIRKALERGEGKQFVRVEGTDRVYRWGLAA